MSTGKAARILLFSGVILAIVTSLFGAPAVAQPAAGNAGAASRLTRDAVGALQARAGAALDVTYDLRYGTVSYLMGPMPYAPSAAVRGDALATAIEFLSANPALYQMTAPAQELALIRTTGDQLGQVHVRLAQQVNGVPVFARSLYVHLDARGQVIGTNGHYVPGIKVDTAPGIKPASAESIALGWQGTQTAAVRSTKLVVYLDSQGDAHLTWLVETYDAATPSRYFTFVEARGGRIVHVMDGLQSARDRLVCDGHNSDAEVCDDVVGREGEVPTEDIAEAAYRNSGAVYDYFEGTHNRDSYDDRGTTLTSIVHFGEALDNAYWNGELMVYGDGDVLFNQPLALSLDVGGHEMSHGVVQETAGLIYETQSGALNESFADVFGVMLDREDWHVGEDVTDGSFWPTPWLRDMEDPSLGGNYDPEDPRSGYGQPSKMSEYANLPVTRQGDWGGVHVNSGITNHAAYLAVTKLGEGAGHDAVEQIWYRALSTYLTESSDFAEFATAILQSAADIYNEGSPEYTAVEEALAEVEITGDNASTPEPGTTVTPRGGPTPGTEPTPDKTSGCTELIKDGGFERGSDSDVWYESTLPEAVIITGDLPRTGDYSAWLGGTDDEQYAFHYVYQDVKIPANAKSVTLGFWHYHNAQLDEGGEPASMFEAVLGNEDGDVVAQLEVFETSQANDSWEQSAYDIKKLAGKTVRVAFTAQMVTGDLSNFFVDDVTLLACTGAQRPPGPTPKPEGGDGITVGGQIVDYSTGDGIAGAVVFFLNPGTSASEAADDGEVTNDEVFTSGVTDRNGQFELDDPLKRDTTYSVIVIADDYYPIIADDAVDTGAWGDVDEFMDLYGEMEPAN